jgi:hypothetical protein
MTTSSRRQPPGHRVRCPGGYEAYVPDPLPFRVEWSADLREVANYVAALEHGVERLGALPLSLRLVREMHGKLMHGVRGDTATPGEFRHSQNWNGCRRARRSGHETALRPGSGLPGRPRL